MCVILIGEYGMCGVGSDTVVGIESTCTRRWHRGRCCRRPSPRRQSTRQRASRGSDLSSCKRSSPCRCIVMWRCALYLLVGDECDGDEGGLHEEGPIEEQRLLVVPILTGGQ